MATKKKTTKKKTTKKKPVRRDVTQTFGSNPHTRKLMKKVN